MSTLSMGTAVQPALAPPAELGNGGSRLFTAIIVVITLFAFMEPIEYAWYRPTYDESDDDERADAGARDGSVQRQITLGALGLIGAATIALSKGKEMRLRNLLGILCVVYLAWCAASILWSDELSMTLRRQIALGCEIVAGVAIATRASPRQFAWIVFACTVTWLGLGILAEVTQGALQPWLTGYRFKGIFHANIMSANCALLVLSSLYLSGGGGKSKKQILYAIAGIAFVFLVLTGSRTALGAVIASIAAVFFATTTPSKRIVSLGLAGLALVFFVAAGGIEAFNLSSNSVSLGRQDNDPASLTGRLPLWSELVGNYVRQRPFAGYRLRRVLVARPHRRRGTDARLERALRPLHVYRPGAERRTNWHDAVRVGDDRGVRARFPARDSEGLRRLRLCRDGDRLRAGRRHDGNDVWRHAVHVVLRHLRDLFCSGR